MLGKYPYLKGQITSLPNIKQTRQLLKADYVCIIFNSKAISFELNIFIDLSTAKVLTPRFYGMVVYK